MPNPELQEQMALLPLSIGGMREKRQGIGEEGEGVRMREDG